MNPIQNFISTTLSAFERRPSRAESETISTPNSLLTEVLTHFAYDAGLVTATGKSKLEEEHGLRIFEEMSRDSQIRAVLQVKKYAVLEGKWEIKPADESAKAKEIADFVTWNMKRFLGDNGLGLEDVLSAFEFGRSLCEKVYGIQKLGKWKNKYYLKRLKAKNIGFINYKLDKYNNVEKYLYTDLQGNQNAVDVDRCVHYSWNSRFENPYGTPDLTSCYQWYWAKKAIYKYMLIFCDKYASPIPEVKVMRNLSDSDSTALNNALKEYHMSNYLRLPKGVELTLHQNNGTAGAVYIQAINQCNAEMARAILGQTLTTNENQKTGTHAQARVHQETLRYMLSKVQNDVERKIVQEQIIEPLVKMNFGEQEDYPVFSFASYDIDYIEKLASVFSTLCNVSDINGNKLVEPTEAWVRERLTLPQRDEKEFPLRTEPPIDPNKQLADNSGETDNKAKKDDKKNGSKPKDSK